MSVRLPRPIALYVKAENAGDVALLSECFEPDAVVRDERRTYEGLAAIQEWKAETKRKYQHTVEPLTLERKGDTIVVTNRLTGSFPGSPIEVRFVFSLEGDKIASLEIG